MKQLITLFGAALICAGLSAQDREQASENPDLYRHIRDVARKEILLPDIDGYKTLKTDLHAHTFYSDGDCSPEYRIKEAWRDGLDAIAITDHIEYRPTDSKMEKYLQVEKRGETDLNVSVGLAQKLAPSYGILVIPGTEITRNPREIGHFNALFTTDNNKIPNDDPLVAIRNAKAQDAIIQINHPGWARNDALLTEPAKQALAEGLVDGIESVNGEEFYPRNIEDALNNNCYVCGNTDIHDTSYDFYLQSGSYRNMTLVFAEDATLSAIKDALLARRTLSYGFGTISGPKELLEKFFLASIDFKKISVKDNGSGTALLTNKTSFTYYIKVPGCSVNILLPALSSIRLGFGQDAKMQITVSNMYYGVDKNPEVVVAL